MLSKKVMYKLEFSFIQICIEENPREEYTKILTIIFMGE